MQMKHHEVYLPNSKPTPKETYILTAHVWLHVGCAMLCVGCATVCAGARGFLDTNMLVLVTRKSRVGGITQCKSPTRGDSCSGGI